MGNREYVRRNTDYKELIKRIFHDISDDNQLKSINNEYTKLDDENSVKDSSMESLISKIIRKNDSIMDLLDGGDISAESDTKEEQKSEFTGKYIPTFLKVRGTQECITHEKQIPSNKQWTYIQFKTDASNDYTTRESDRGELIVEWNKDILNGTYYDPYDGIIRVKLGGEGIEGDKIGDLKVALTRPNTEPLECTINLYFGEPKQGPKKRPPVSKDTGISIPKYTWIRRDQWDQFGWDEDTVAVADLENIRINRNNRTLEEFKRNRPSEDGNKITSKFGIHIYFTSLMLYLEMKDDPEYEKIFGKAISAASKICLPIAYDFDDDAIQKFSRLEQVISK